MEIAVILRTFDFDVSDQFISSAHGHPEGVQVGLDLDVYDFGVFGLHFTCRSNKTYIHSLTHLAVVLTRTPEYFSSQRFGVRNPWSV